MVAAFIGRAAGSHLGNNAFETSPANDDVRLHGLSDFFHLGMCQVHCFSLGLKLFGGNLCFIFTAGGSSIEFVALLSAVSETVAAAFVETFLEELAVFEEEACNLCFLFAADAEFLHALVELTSTDDTIVVPVTCIEDVLGGRGFFGFGIDLEGSSSCDKGEEFHLWFGLK